LEEETIWVQQAVLTTSTDYHLPQACLRPRVMVVVCGIEVVCIVLCGFHSTSQPLNSSGVPLDLSFHVEGVLVDGMDIVLRGKTLYVRRTELCRSGSPHVPAMGM
jgi:hypothetical protein